MASGRDAYPRALQFWPNAPSNLAPLRAGCSRGVAPSIPSRLSTFILNYPPFLRGAGGFFLGNHLKILPTLYPIPNLLVIMFCVFMWTSYTKYWEGHLTNVISLSYYSRMKKCKICIRRKLKQCEASKRYRDKRRTKHVRKKPRSTR